MMGHSPVKDDIIDLRVARIGVARRKLAGLVAERLCAISCEVHGKTAVAICTVEDDGDRCVRYPHGTCCPAHSALLHVSLSRIERELYESTGYLRALLVDDAKPKNSGS